MADTTIPPPSADDMARDAAADLQAAHAYSVRGNPVPPALAPIGCWIRRAVAAEAECEKLRAAVRECVAALPPLGSDETFDYQAEAIMRARKALGEDEV